ncbi:MAG: hypothetical protein PHG16_08640 [Lachnospiraceae bacterium]|nr:hypothetical protein [Lachnospiraceae bacterium]
MNKVHYFRSDIQRLIKNYPIYLAVFGVAVSIWFSLENYAFEEEMVNGNVLDTYSMAVNLSGIMIAYAFCAFSYATVFCEDLENKYARYSINRGNVWKYVVSKAVVVYGSSVITMVLGSLLFISAIRLKIPWTSDFGGQDMYLTGMYCSLIAGEHYWAYIFLCTLQMGMLAGVLSLAASFLSMFVSNKMLILITPILIQQILLEYRGKSWFSVMLIYPNLNQFSTDIQYFLTVFGCSLCFSALFTWGIYKKIKNRL